MIYRIRLIVITGISFGLFLLPGRVDAQVLSATDKQLPWSIGIRGGITNIKLVDAAFSQLDLKGYGVAAGLFAIHKSAVLDQMLSLSLLKGNGKNNNAKDFRTRQLMFDLTYSALFRVTGSGGNQFSVFAGPGIRLYYADRSYDELINRNHSFENLAALDLVVGFSYHPDELIPGLGISDYVSSAVIGAYSDETTQKKSPGATLSTTNAGFSNIFSYQKFLALPDATSIKNTLAMYKNVTDQHTVGLSYGWQYIHFRTGYETKQANHLVSIFYNYNF